MNIKTLTTNLGLTSALVLGASLAAIAPATAQTTESGRTLQDLRTNAGSESGLTLQELRDRATALEIERNSRDRNYTGNAADSPTINTSATGGNDAVLARLNAESGRATVLLVNNTGAEVTYEAIGQTPPRLLAADASVRLDSLPMPVTLTAERRNFGLVDMFVTVTDEGILSVNLERSEFDEVQGALRIREDGYVFAN